MTHFPAKNAKTSTQIINRSMFSNVLITYTRLGTTLINGFSLSFWVITLREIKNYFLYTSLIDRVIEKI